MCNVYLLQEVYTIVRRNPEDESKGNIEDVVHVDRIGQSYRQNGASRLTKPRNDKNNAGNQIGMCKIRVFACRSSC